MAVETPSLFARVIQDHLELKRRNAELEPAMPIDGYRIDDPFDNHPLFKTEEQARLEETMDGDEPAVSVEATPLTWPGEESVEHVAESSDGAREEIRACGRSRATSTGATSTLQPGVAASLRSTRPALARVPVLAAERPFTRAGDRSPTVSQPIQQATAA